MNRVNPRDLLLCSPLHVSTKVYRLATPAWRPGTLVPVQSYQSEPGSGRVHIWNRKKNSVFSARLLACGTGTELVRQQADLVTDGRGTHLTHAVQILIAQSRRSACPLPCSTVCVSACLPNLHWNIGDATGNRWLNSKASLNVAIVPTYTPSATRSTSEEEESIRL